MHGEGRLPDGGSGGGCSARLPGAVFADCAAKLCCLNRVCVRCAVKQRLGTGAGMVSLMMSDADHRFDELLQICSELLKKETLTSDQVIFHIYLKDLLSECRTMQ